MTEYYHSWSYLSIDGHAAEFCIIRLQFSHYIICAHWNRWLLTILLPSFVYYILLIAKMMSLKFLLSFINYLNLTNVSNTYFVQGSKINPTGTAMNKLVSLFITPGAYKEDTTNCQSFTMRKEFILCNKTKVLLHNIRWCPHAHLGSWKSVMVLMIIISRIFYVCILCCWLVELFGKD